MKNYEIYKGIKKLLGGVENIMPRLVTALVHIRFGHFINHQLRQIFAGIVNKIRIELPLLDYGKYSHEALSHFGDGVDKGPGSH